MSMSPRTRVDLFFSSRLKRDPQGVTFAPGRLVLLGEHLDHQGGPVLAVPLEEGVAVAYAVRPDTRIAVWALNAKAKDLFVSGEWVKTGRRWSDMAKGACAHVASRGYRVPGLDLVVFGDLEPGEGMASSAAFITALLGAIYAAVGEDPTPRRIALDVAAIEREWAGVICGTMDPYVSCVGSPNTIVLLDCATHTHEELPMPAGVVIESESTGIKRSLAATPYNERRRELAAALALIRQTHSDLERLPELSRKQFEALADALPELERKRARHVVTETARVREAVAAIQSNDVETLGTLLLQGHRSLSADFESTLPEIDDLVEALNHADGVLGARLQGAGWGGRLIVLREADA